MITKPAQMPGIFFNLRKMLSIVPFATKYFKFIFQSLLRVLEKDVTMPDGEVIPKGITFSVDFASLMTDPNIFHEPQKFNPTRFLDDSLKG